MTQEIYILAITAASIGFFHTIFGPDHYLPFIVLSKARNWTLQKTMGITFLCGLGHVLSSVVLGLIGVAFGVLLAKLEWFEGFRGSIAAWALIVFGLLYAIWGLKRAYSNKPHTHSHFHDDGVEHTHEHVHMGGHSHPHTENSKKTLAPWVLFIIFVFGPCEPLIPILMYPAAKSSVFGMVFVASVFSIVTIGTMLGVVIASTYGLKFVKLGKIEKYSHALAGAAIFMSGMAIQFLGL